MKIVSMSTDPESRRDFGPYLEGVGPTYQDGGETKLIRYGVIEDLQRALELHGKNVAAFLVEPIQGEAGYVAESFSKSSSDFLLVIALSFHRMGTLRRSMRFARSTTCC